MAAPQTTIKRKLMVAIMGTSLATVVLACAIFITYEVLTFKRNLVQGITNRAEIIAANSTAALAFQNQEDATEILASFKKDPRMVAAALYDSSGRLFAQYPEDAPPSVFPATPQVEAYYYEGYNFYLFVPVKEDSRWLGTVYLKFSLAILKQRYQVYSGVVVFVILTAMLVAFILSTEMQRRIAGPILALAQSARRVSDEKDYSAKTTKVSDDEVGFLTEAFNDMLGEIQRRESSLHASEARTRAILESALDSILTLDFQGKIIGCNPAAESMFGYKRARAIGMTLDDLIILPADEKLHRTLMEFLTTQVIGSRREMVGRRADGTEFPIELAVTLVTQEGPSMYTVFVHDLTERKRAEQAIRQLNTELERRVIERTAELEASNKELEAFSYSVSHDLRAPLRGIDGFSKSLLESYGEALDSEGRRQLGRVRLAAQRMSTLIDAMLKLARINRLELRRELVDLSPIANQVAADLMQSQPDRVATFQIEPSLNTIGDPQLLRVVIDNLISNAWKYTSKHPSARIEFGSRSENGVKVFFVRDDGAGFDMAHSNLLFSPFQRLHRQSDFEGTGVGLATVQRIIRRHGGKLWANGEVEKGATFYFTV